MSIYFGTLCTQGQETWYYRECRDSSTCMKCQSQWRPSSKRCPFRGHAEKCLVSPREHHLIHSLVICQLKVTHVGFQKDQEVPRNAWKMRGNERTLNWFPLLCVCACVVHVRVSMNTCPHRFVCVYAYTCFPWVSVGCLPSLFTPAFYFLRQRLSLYLELTSWLGWLNNKLQWSSLLMIGYLNSAPRACMVGILQTELSFYKWTILQFDFLVGDEEPSFWKSGGCLMSR